MTELAYGDANRMRTAAEARNPLRRVVSAEEIAGAFAYLAGPDGRNVTGQILTVDAGLADLRLDASYYDKPMDYFGVDGRENS
jgi:enoyl-[acyl-carrier-protein] reductase (NADH)